MSARLTVADVVGPVVVMAPHPDDETLGCGGLIALLTKAGKLVHTIFVTDGSASHRNSPSWTPDRLALQRQQEAAEALSLLGAGNQPRTFLGLKDAAMPAPGTQSYESATKSVVSILAALRPSLIVAPWRRDPHCDHRDTWTLTKDAMGRTGQRSDFLDSIWLEELGEPGDFPTAGEVEVVEFGAPDLEAIKRRALAAHASQLGGLIEDDPTGFSLTAETVGRFIKPTESFWRA